MTTEAVMITVRRHGRTMALVALSATVLGCGLAAVSDPTAILEGQVNDATGAEFLRRGAIRQFAVAFPQVTWESGVVADEFRFQVVASPVWRDGE